MTTKRSMWVLLSVIGAGLALRLFHLGTQSLWMDEAGSVRYALSPLVDIVAALKAHGENHPPFYFMLLHGQIAVGEAVCPAISQAEWWVRLPSVVCGIGTVALTYAFARDVSGDRRAALASGAFMAISAYQINYSQEVRMYALAILLALSANYFFWHTLQRPAQRLCWWGYIASTAACAYTHYLTFFCWLAQALTAWVACPAGGFWKRWGFAQLAIVLLLLPLFVYMMQMRPIDRSLMIVPRSMDALLLVLSCAYGNHLSLSSGAGTLVAVVLSLPLLWLCVAGARRMPRAAWTLLAGNFLLPAVSLFVLARTTSYHLFIVNYFGMFQPCLAILAARGIVSLRVVLAVPLTALVVGLNLLSLFHMYFDANYQSQDWRTTGNLLTRRVTAQDLVVVQPSMFVVPLRYYYRGSARVLPLDDDADGVLGQQVAAAKEVWLCDMPSHPVVQQHALKDSLDRTWRETEEFRTVNIWPHNVIRLIHYARRPLQQGYFSTQRARRAQR